MNNKNWKDAVSGLHGFDATDYIAIYAGEGNLEETTALSIDKNEGEEGLYAVWLDFCQETGLHPDRLIAVERG